MGNKFWLCIAQISTIIGFAGCVWFYLVPVEALVLGDIYAEYVTSGYIGMATLGDVAYYGFSVGFVVVFVVVGTIIMRNIVCVLGGIGLGGLILYCNLPYGLKHPQLFNMFGSWEAVIFVLDLVINAGFLVFCIGYIIWYIRNRRKKGKNDGE